VLDLLARAGTDIAPAEGESGIRKQSGTLKLSGASFTPVWAKPDGPGIIRALEFSVPKDQALAFSRARLRIVWDGHRDASVDAPISLFYGAGILYNRDDRPYLVKSFPMVIRHEENRVYLSCYFPMPFLRSARIEIAGLEGAEFSSIGWSVRYADFKDSASSVGYFHATYRDHLSPEAGKDLQLLDTRDVEGGGDWSGQFRRDVVHFFSRGGSHNPRRRSPFLL
jgi:hypothetical protein